MDDTSLSGIEIRQVALLSDQWRLKPAQSVVTPSGPGGVVIHPQESLISALFAIRSDGKVDSVRVLLFHPSVLHRWISRRIHIGTLLKNCRNPLPRPLWPSLGRWNYWFKIDVLKWMWSLKNMFWIQASQASEDGMGSTAIEGLHYFGWSGPDIAS